MRYRRVLGFGFKVLRSRVSRFLGFRVSGLGFGAPIGTSEANHSVGLLLQLASYYRGLEN